MKKVLTSIKLYGNSSNRTFCNGGYHILDRLTINYLLALAGKKHQDIADMCNPPVTRAAVTQVIGGYRNNPRIQKEVANALNRQPEDLFSDGKKPKRNRPNDPLAKKED